MRAMPAPPQIVFFGTPEFAVPTLDALAAAGRLPAAVVTQPARPAGRGQRTQDSPVARWALAHDLPLLRPERVREPGFLDELRAVVGGVPGLPGLPDIAIVVAFGQIFPPALLDLPRQGCINLHASLLPRYRGAAPIQAAIAAGERRTGVSTMQMEAGLDSGPVLLQREVEIGPAETAGELAPRLAAIGGDLVVETLERLARGDLAARPQAAELATYAPRLSRESGAVDWSLPAPELYDRLRAYTPWPGLTAELRGRPVKLVWAVPIVGYGLRLVPRTGDWLREAPEGDGPQDQTEPVPIVPTSATAADAAAPGTYLGLADGRAAVACGAGTALAILSLQRPGKRALPAADFVNGERLLRGESFG
jgi:methionyl-tRNA formyltransferase